MLIAEFGTGQVLWSIVWLSVFALQIFLIIMVFGEVVQARYLSGWAKAMWTVAIIFLPYLGILIYLIVRGGGMSDRAMAQAKQQQESMNSYIRETSAPSSSADELTKLAELHANGKLDDAEYASAKSKVLNA